MATAKQRAAAQEHPEGGRERERHQGQDDAASGLRSKQVRERSRGKVEAEVLRPGQIDLEEPLEPEARSTVVGEHADGGEVLGRILEGQEPASPERHHGRDGGQGTQRRPGERGGVPPERHREGQGAGRRRALHHRLP